MSVRYSVQRGTHIIGSWLNVIGFLIKCRQVDWYSVTLLSPVQSSLSDSGKPDRAVTRDVRRI